MSTQEQLIEFVIQDVIAIMMRENNLTWDDAMKQLYASPVFEKLNDTETGLYLRSPAYVYELLKA